MRFGKQHFQDELEFKADDQLDDKNDQKKTKYLKRIRELK